MRSRRTSVTPICRNKGATAVSMKSRSLGSASLSSVSGLGTRARSIIRALARSAVMREAIVLRSWFCSDIETEPRSSRRPSGRQPDAAALFLGLREQMMRQRNVVRDQPGRVDEDPFVRMGAPRPGAGDHVLDFGVEP